MITEVHYGCASYELVSEPTLILYSLVVSVLVYTVTFNTENSALYPHNMLMYFLQCSQQTTIRPLTEVLCVFCQV